MKSLKTDSNPNEGYNLVKESVVDPFERDLSVQDTGFSQSYFSSLVFFEEIYIEKEVVQDFVDQPIDNRSFLSDGEKSH